MTPSDPETQVHLCSRFCGDADRYANDRDKI